MNVRKIAMTPFIVASLAVCAEATTIDRHLTPFDGPPGGIITVSSGGVAVGNVTSGVDIVGTEREALLENLSGPGSVSVEVTGGDLIFTSDTDTKGRFSVLFDGVGTSSASLDVSADDRVVHNSTDIVGTIRFTAIATDGAGETATRTPIDLTTASVFTLESFFASDFSYSIDPQFFDGSNIVRFEASFEDVSISGGSSFKLGVVESVPEPSTLLLAALGLLGLLGFGRRRRRRAK